MVGVIDTVFDPVTVAVAQFGQRNLADSQDRAGDQGADEAGKRSTEQRADQQHQWRHVDDPAADQRLDDMVLERLVRDEHRERDDPGPRSLAEAERDER